jgi:maltose-binding protein MalE
MVVACCKSFDVALEWMSLKTTTTNFKKATTCKVPLHVTALIKKEDNVSSEKIPPAMTTREQLKVATPAPEGTEMIDPS